MTIYELAKLMLDASCQHVKIFDFAHDDVTEVFDGMFDEVPEEYEDMEISSIDNVYGDVDYIGINIDTEWN